MNTNFIKKGVKIIGAVALAGFGTFAADRIADDKSVFGKLGKADDEDETTESKVQMRDINDEAEHIEASDVKVEKEFHEITGRCIDPDSCRCIRLQEQG